MSGVDRSRLLLAAVGLGALVRLWVMPLGSSLSLDEFGTWWVTNGRFDEILSRARLFPQSVPYAAAVWLARALGGSSEIALRLPSLLAAGLAVYCLYRLGLELFDRNTGLLAAGIFVGFPQICFAAGDARPYAFAVLATIGALWMLVRWLERSRATDAFGYVLFATAAVYFQYLFATMFVVHAAYVIRRWRRGCGVPPRQLLLVAVGIAALTAPAALLALEVGSDRALHAFGVMPDVKAVVLSLVPAGVLAALLASFLVCWKLGLVGRRPHTPVWSKGFQEEKAARVPPRDALWLLSLSAVVPAAILFMVSRVTGTSVFVSRYMMCMIPGQALLMAWFLRGVLPTRGQRAVVPGYLLILFLARGLKIAHTGEDWRGAVAALNVINGSHPVLMSGTYTESRNLDWVQDGKHVAYMRAPLDFYATAGRAVILPLNVGRDAESYVEELLNSTPGLKDRFVLIERSSKFPSWAPWLDERLRPSGFRMRKVWDHGNPSAWVFERSVPHA
ncbi:MAG: glycosyltransferase family 39 protein [Thermoanaerobaculia bacterium]